jgi:uncharacterized membrane protein (UPF0127 family)
MINEVKEMRKIISLSVLFFILFSSVCAAPGKFIKIFYPNGFEVTTELAITEAERQLGLMFRDKLDPDQGMLLVFEQEGYYSIWMKNMKIPLDILWLDKDKRIVHIERSVPPCKEEPCPSYRSEIPSMYVLEVKSGEVERNKIKLYNRLDFVLEK